MNIFNRFWNKTEKEVQMECIYSSRMYSSDERLKESRADKVNYDGYGRTTYGSGLPPTTKYTDPLKAFQNYPVVYGAITAISDAISSLGVKVYKIKGGKQEEDQKHDFYDVFRKPNPYQSSQEFLEAIVINTELFGNCFIAKEGKGTNLELYVLTTKNVAIIPDPKNKVAEYRYVINGQTVKYKPEEIIHIKYTNPDDPYYGLSPLASAKEVLALENNRLTFASAFFRNSAVPPAVLQSEGYLAETTLNKLRGDWERLHRGGANFGRVAILTGGLKFQSLTSPLKDLNLDKLKELSTGDILTIYRIPAVVLGDMSQVSGEEGKAALTAFYRNSILPKVKRIETALNRGLNDTLFKDKHWFEFDLRNVPALQEDKVTLAQYIEKLMGASVMTSNEARSIIGLPPSVDPWSDSLMVSNSFFGSNLIPTSEIGNQGAGSNQAKPSNNPKNPTGGGNQSKPAKAPQKELEDMLMRLKELTEKVNSG